MGLFTGLLTLPLAPVRGTIWIAEQLRDQAQRDLDERLRRQLDELAVAYELGEIDDLEYEKAEAELLDELERSAPDESQEVMDDGSDGAAAEARGGA